MKKTLLILFTAILMSPLAFSQSENVGINTTSPDNSAALHVTYVTTPKGMLVPRLTTAQRGNIPSPIANGLLIFNTTTNRFEYYDSGATAWRGLITDNSANSVSWSRTGNAGTTPGTDFLGTTDNTAFTLFTNNTERLRLNANGNFGVGTNNPLGLFSVGNTSQFQINSTGAISNATGITSSGNIIFSGLTADLFLRTTTGGQLATFDFSQDLDVATTGVSTVEGIQGRPVSALAPANGQVLKWNGASWSPANDDGSLFGGNTLNQAYDEGGNGSGRDIDVTDGAVQLIGTNTADETIEISNSGDGGTVLVQNTGDGEAVTIENTGSGNSLVVNDEASDTTPFTIDADGQVGVMTSSPAAAFDVDSTFKMGKNGSILHQIVKDTVSFALPIVSAGVRQIITVTVNGAEAGGVVSVSPVGAIETHMIIGYAFVSNTDEVKIVFFNASNTDSAAQSAQNYFITVVN